MASFSPTLAASPGDPHAVLSHIFDSRAPNCNWIEFQFQVQSCMQSCFLAERVTRINKFSSNNNNNTNTNIGNLDNPYSLSLIYLVMMISFHLVFSSEIFTIFKTHVIRRTRASVSTIMCELGKKSKKYYRMRDMS